MKNILARYKFPIVLILSVLSMGGAVAMTTYYFSLKEQELREKINAESRMTPVVVARRDLAPGSVLTADTFAVREIPADYIPNGAITPDKFGGYEGKFLSEPLASGKPLLRHYIKGITQVEKFSDLLQPGQRAITLQVDGVSSVEHMIEAGDYIDLGVKYKKGAGFDLLLERVLVLSTGNLTTADPKAPGMYKNADYGTLTLGVQDSYVEKVFEAHAKGELAFLLRNEKDKNLARYSGGASDKKVVVFAGKKAEGGLLEEIQDDGALNKASREEPMKRNELGRIVRKSELKSESSAASSESELNKGMAVNENQK
jgi:pilus assembly protein CpaB